jgi:hypothetical protein
LVKFGAHPPQVELSVINAVVDVPADCAHHQAVHFPVKSKVVSVKSQSQLTLIYTIHQVGVTVTVLFQGAKEV